MGDIRETFETAHKVLLACDKTMEAFGSFLRRIRLPREYDGGVVPWECRTPDVLVRELQELHSLFEQLEICYLYDPASKADILRALSSRPAVPVPAMLNVTAETHVEAVWLVASQIHSALNWIGVLIGIASYDTLEFKPGFASECEERANRVREFTRNGRLASSSLDYLRRAVAIEEATCREFFEPPTTTPQSTPTEPPANDNGYSPTLESADTPKNTEIIPQGDDDWANALLKHQNKHRTGGKVIRAINREFFEEFKNLLGKTEPQRKEKFKTVKSNARRIERKAKPKS